MILMIQNEAWYLFAVQHIKPRYDISSIWSSMYMHIQYSMYMYPCACVYVCVCNCKCIICRLILYMNKMQNVKPIGKCCNDDISLETLWSLWFKSTAHWSALQQQARFGFVWFCICTLIFIMMMINFFTSQCSSFLCNRSKEIYLR